MMKTMRKNMKVILWIVVVAFVGTIFFVWGMDLGRQKDFVAQQSAAMVNDKPISNEEFERLWSQQSQALYAQSKEEPSRAQLQKMRKALISELIDRELLRQQYSKLGFSIFPQEIASRIASMSAFQQNGKFSQEKYMTLLNYNHINPEEFEASEKSSLEVLKMEMFVKNAVLISDDELRQYFRSRSRELKLKVAAFNWKDKAKSITVPEAELTAYFNAHRSEFEQTAEVKAAHILIRLDEKATEEQKLTARLKTENIRNEISKGLDFAAAAVKYSEDPGSAKTGGDLGFFKAGMMVPAFEKAAFALKVGELSQPVQSQFGFHLIKVTDRKEAKNPAFAEVRGKILEQLKETKAKDETQKAAAAFVASLVDTKDLAKTAQATNTALISTGWLKTDGKINTLEKSDVILDRAFNLPVKKPSSTISAGDAVFFAEVQEEKWNPMDENGFSRQRQSLLEKLKTVKAEETVAQWLKEFKTTGKVINNIEKEKNENE
jgi:peptidyl-prolyl cis-trans isomerase D